MEMFLKRSCKFDVYFQNIEVRKMQNFGATLMFDPIFGI